eukprot:392034-Rhodomonas_salina.1
MTPLCRASTVRTDGRFAGWSRPAVRTSSPPGRGEVDAALDAKRAAMQQKRELEGAGGAEVVDDCDQDDGVEVEREG